MTKKFNVREGFNLKDDRLPARFHEEALPSGHSITSEEMEQMLSEYYLLRGWRKQDISGK
jgi:aldehyde:ferredoxin oxidoreductase